MEHPHIEYKQKISLWIKALWEHEEDFLGMGEVKVEKDLVEDEER